MKLKMNKRMGTKKSDLGKLRREGSIPAVLYSPERSAESIMVDGVEFGAILRGIVPGRLATTTFTLIREGKEVPAIIKDIQYHPTTYAVLHLDFEELIPGVPVNINVPIEFTGVADCSGIKLGGFLRTVVRSLKVRCMPDQIPGSFPMDVRELSIGQAKRLSSLEIPEGISPLVSLEEVAFVIAKR